MYYLTYGEFSLIFTLFLIFFFTSHFLAACYASKLKLKLVKKNKYELNQNRTDIYFRDKKILYLIKLLILGDKRFELIKAKAIEFTAQPFLPIKEPSFI